MAELIPPNALRIKINSFITPASVRASEVLVPPYDHVSEDCLKLHKLEDKLSKEINRNRNKRESVPYREVDDLVAIRSLDDQRRWHRGKIELRMESASGPQYKVFLQDQGITLRAKPDHLRNLPFNTDYLPAQAMNLTLQGIVPASLTLSLDLESFNSEISAGWVPAAHKFVENIRKTYSSAYFVPKEGSPAVQVTCSGVQMKALCGDIFVEIPDYEQPVSLSDLLCGKQFAKVCPLEFERRQQILNVDDAPVVTDSPLPSASSTESDSASPSPARSMMNSPRRTISEYLQSVAERERAESSSQSTSETEQVANSSPRKGHHALIARLKKCNSTGCNKGSSSASDISPSPSPSPTKDFTPLHSRDNPVEVSTPRALDARFVPAGRSITTEHQARSRQSYSSSLTKSSDSEGSFSSPRQSVKTQNGPSNSNKPFQNGQDHLVGSKLDYSSESSLSDSSVPGKGCVSFKATSLEERSNNSMQKTVQPNNTSPCHLDDSLSPPSLQGRMSLFSKLKKQLVVPPSLTDESSGSTDESSSSGATGSKISINVDQPKSLTKDFTAGFTRNKILSCSAPKTFRSVPDEEDISTELYLARPVLLHGGFYLKPWVTWNDFRHNLSSTIGEYLLSRKWSFNVLTLEKYMWPAIQHRQNVIMISPKSSGKTSSYIIPLMDFMCSMEGAPKGCGPLALILCSGSQSATKIYEDCVRVVRNMKNPPQVQATYGLVLEKPFIFKLINGCEIFITTPPCLLRILKNHSYAMNFHRLQHFILDEADIMMTRFLNEIREIQAKIVAEQAKEGRDPIQIIVASEKWEPHLLSFCEHMLGNPLLCINDYFEACVYGKPDVVFHLTEASQKPSKLINVLKSVAGLEKVVVFCDATELSLVVQFIENACLNVLPVEPCTTASKMEAFLSSWKASGPGSHYILVCPDCQFDELKIRDATCVVNYSFPFLDKSYFVKRLSAILNSLPNKLEEKTMKSTNGKPHHRCPAIHLLMDESNSEQLPVIVQLMERIAGKLDSQFLDIAKKISMRKEKRTKKDKLFCKNIKMFGHCLNGYECPNRHVFVPELDVSEILPSSGIVSMQVTKVHSAGHYSVRLVEHIDVNRTKKKWPSAYVKIGLMMSAYFSKEENRIMHSTVNVGDLFAVETDSDLCQRVQILEVKEKDKYGKPLSLLVQFIDEGNIEVIKAYMLRELPEDLKTFPAQVVDVFLCGLLPADKDSSYGADANSNVKKWIKSNNDAEDSKQKLLQGQIMLSMAGSLWVDPVNILEWLPHSQEYVVRRNIKQSLLQGNYALPNPEHLPKLLDLCGIDQSVVPSVNGASRCPIKSRTQPTPSWAFLETDVLQDVEFICAESVSVFFVRRVKFQPLLDALIKDIMLKDIPRKSEEVSLLTPGSICLAKYEDEWHRVRITSQNEDNSVTVFYVDFGDTENVTHEEIKCIPDWAITRLPFQAIECSLAGVQSCDNVDKLFEMAHQSSLVAKVCRKKDAVLTGGNHYVVALVDCSKPNPSILNKDLLELEGVIPHEEEMEYLNFEIDESLRNRFGGVAEAGLPVSEYETFEENPGLNQPDAELNLSDLEFKDDDDTDDGLGNFEIYGLDKLTESFKHQNKEAVEELANQMKASTLDQKLPVKTVGNNHTAHIDKANVKGKPQQVADEDEDWEEGEHEYLGRNILPVLCSARPPTTKWLEDLYFVWIKICVTGVEDYFLQWTCDSFQFSTSVNGRNYHIDQQLRGAIVPSCVTSSVKGFSVEIKMKKACCGVLWERLFSPKRRFAWLTRDLDAIVSSDSECEDTLKTINKEIRKIPVKLRRRPLDRFEKSQPVKPDLESDSSDSNCEYEMIDSDEMF